MGGLGDFVNTFRAGMRSGPTPVGTWKEMEKFGRFEGTGEVGAELALPPGPIAISVEDYLMVQDLEAQLTGPSGERLLSSSITRSRLTTMTRRPSRPAT